MKRRHLIPILLSALCILLVPTVSSLQASPPASEATHEAYDEVQAAWQRANELGVYHYTSDIVQTTWPLPKLENVGLSSKTDRLYIEGQVDRHADRMNLLLWSQGGSVRTREGAIELRVSGDETQGRIGSGEWKDLEEFNAMFAPDNDPLGFLAGLDEVVKEDAHPSAASKTLTRYSFDLNGPAFAAYMRDQLEAELVNKGELPPGISLDTARVYAGMTGTGEILLDERGLPRRQVIHAEFPPQGRERIEVAITTDFSDWSEETPEAKTVAWGDILSDGLLATALGTLVGALILLPSRSRYTLICGLAITSMLVTPLLQSQQVYAFTNRQAQDRARSERERERADQEEALRDSLYSTDFDPHANPLASNASNVIRHSSSVIHHSTFNTHHSTFASSGPCDALDTDSGIDTDQDGLTDIQEACVGTSIEQADTDGDGLLDGAEVFDLGTNPLADGWDTDGDGINDGAEVRGFVDDQNQTWHLDPLSLDSNGDGIIDSLEVPVSEAGEIDCGSVTADGSARCSNAQVDTDRDGTPDAFDFDDDNDGVPDQIDNARPRVLGSYGSGKPQGLEDQKFTFSLSDVKLDTPVFVDFQLRPVNPDHLWYSMNVLDWPAGDTEGQIQRVHETTFGDSGKEANGDMRLIPMLEIEIPYQEGHYGNLPVKPGAPEIQPSTPITAWLDTTQTDLYNISIRKENEAGDLLAYVPLSLVQDPTGDSVVAFAGRMVYWPSVADMMDPALADGGPAQTVRLAWAVQAKTDICRDVPDDFMEDSRDDTERYESWCADPAHWDENVTFVHTYHDDWYLTGFSVREDRGLETAVIYEQPDYALSHDYDAATYYEFHLWSLVNGLDKTFIAGRGQDTNGDGINDARDMTIDDIYARFHTGSFASETKRWSIPADALQVERQSFSHQGYLPTLPMTTTPEILNRVFTAGGQPKIANPTLLFAREERFRQASLDGSDEVIQADANLYRGIMRTNQIEVHMTQDRVPETVLAGISWAPFTYDSDAQEWQSGDIEEYVAKLKARQVPWFEEVSEWGSSPDAVRGATRLTSAFYLTLYTGINQTVEMSGRPLTLDYASTDEDVTFKPAMSAGSVAKAIVDEVLAQVDEAGRWWALGAKLMDSQRLRWLFGAGAADAHRRFLTVSGQSVGGGTGTLKSLWGYGLTKKNILIRSSLVIGAVLVGAVAALYAAAMIFDFPHADYICTSIMVVLMVALAAKAFKGLYDLYKVASPGLIGIWAQFKESTKMISRAAKIGFIVGIIITVAVAIGLFLFSAISGKLMPGSTAFNQTLALAVATIIVGIIMLVIAMIPVVGPIIVGIIGAIDILIMLACMVVEKTADPSGMGWDIVKNYVCGGITGLMTTLVQMLIYDLNPVVDLQAPERFQPTNFSLELDEPRMGFMVGNHMSINADVITYLYRNMPFEPDKIQRDIDALIHDGDASALQSLLDNFGPGIFFAWQFADPFIKRAAFRYQLSTDDEYEGGVNAGEMDDEWEDASDHIADSRRYVTTQRTDEVNNVHFTEAGINWHPPLYLVEKYKLLAQECTAIRIPAPPYYLAECHLRRQGDSLAMDMGEQFKFDVFPATLDGFYTLAGQGQGSYSLAWDERFPTLVDADGDGLRSQATGGNDPDDAYADTDGDGLSDYYELQHGLPVRAGDEDNDGLSDYEEVRYETSSRLADSDGDGLSDKEEIEGWDFVYAFDANDQPLYTHVTSDPNDPDTDGDGLTDKLEQVYHFHPRVYSRPDVLTLDSVIDDADGIVAPGQAIVYTATVENQLRDIYALGLLELEFPASQDPYPEPRVYELAPRQAMTVSNQTVVDPALSVSGQISLTQRAGAELTDLRGEAGGRVMWLTLNEGAGATHFEDATLEGNHGTCIAPHCPDSDVAGYFGKGARFDGVDDYIRIPRSVADDFTISFWFKSDQIAGSDGQWWEGMGLVDGEVTGSADDFGISLGNGRVLFGVGNPDNTARSEFVADGKWHHVAATRDKELGVLRLYVDGDLVDSDKYDGSTASLTSPPELRIGSLQTNRRFFEGTIDDVQITPYTLSADEVMELYNQPVFRLSMDDLDCNSNFCTTYDDMGDVGAEALCINSNICPEETDGVQKGGIEMKGIPLEVDQHSALSLHDGRFSQSVWVKPTSETTHRQGLWGYSPAWNGGASRSDPSEEAFPSLFIVNGSAGSAADLEVGFGDGATWRGCVFEDLLTLNEWNHVVATYDGNDYVIYIDGQREGTCGIGENPPLGGRFDIGRATHCATVENPEVHCINEADHGDTGEFYAYFDDDGWDGKWWYEEGIDDGDVFYPDADPRDYCDGTTLSVEEYDDDDPDDFIDDYWFSYRDPSRDWSQRFRESSDGNDLYLDLIHANPSIPFEGAMDELALYRRTLSEDDVQALYLSADRIFEIDFDETPGRAVFADATANDYAAHCDPAAPATCPDSGMPGRFNQAIRFDGVDDALTINPLRMPPNATVGAWVQPNNPGDESIISYREINPQMGFGLGLEDGKPYAHLGQYRVEGSVALPDHAWTHLTAVYSHNPYYVYLRLYQDGVPVGELEQAIVAGNFRPFGYTSSETTIGGKFGDHFAGRLDQVVVIRRALSGEQVIQLQDEAPSASLHLDEPLRTSTAATTTQEFDNIAAPDNPATCDPSPASGEYGCPAAGDDGWIRNATVFDGEARLTLPDTTLATGDGFSIGGWFRLHRELTSTQQTLVSKDGVARLFIPGQGETVTRTLAYLDVGGEVLEPSPDYPGLMLKQWMYVFATYEYPDAGETLGRARLYINGHKVGEAELSPGFSLSAPSPNANPLEIGEDFIGMADEIVAYNYALSGRDIEHIYEYQVHWYDAADSHNITVDAEAPIVTLELADYIKNRDLVLAAIAHDTTSHVTDVVYRLNGGAWQTTTRDYNAWVFTFNPERSLSEGVHTLDLRATDLVGHVGELNKTFHVDSTPPSISLAPALMTGVLDSSGGLRLYGTVTDDGSGVDKVFVTLVDSLGAAVSSPQLAQVTGDRGSRSSRWEVVYTSTVPLNGRYIVQLEASDRLGQINSNAQQHASIQSDAQMSAMSAFGDRATSDQQTLKAPTAPQALPVVELDSLPPLADMYSVGESRWAITGTSPLPIISGTLNGAPYPTGQILALHLEEPSGATRFQDAAPSHVLGTCAGSSCPQTGRPWQYGQAATFDGDDVIELGVHRRLGDLARAGSMTLLAWVNPDDTAGEQHLLDADTADTDGFDWRVVDGRQQFELYGAETFAATGALLPAGQWSHLAIVMENQASGTLATTFYVNGQAQKTITTTVTGQANEDDGWLIGQGWTGQLDEVIAYGRALSADQILALAHPASTGVETLEVGLLPIQDWAQEEPSQWLIATLDPADEPFSNWHYQLPSQQEGYYRLSLRATDELNQRLTLPNVWQGQIDTAAPRVELLHLDPRFSGDLDFYRCQATDTYLSADDYDCPVPGSAPTYYTDPFSRTQLITYTSPFVGVHQTDPGDRLTACDIFGQCATASPTTISEIWTLGVTILTPTASLAESSAVISTPTTPLTVTGAAYAQADLQDLNLNLGSQEIYTTTWPTGTQQSTWNTTYTPTLGDEGIHALLASLSDRAGGVITSAAPITSPILASELPGPLSYVYVDFTPPDLSLSTERVNSANFDNGLIQVSGLISEVTWLTHLQARVGDGAWRDAAYSATYPLAGDPWTAYVRAPSSAPPEDTTYTLTVRAIDVAGRTDEITRVLAADAVPPTPPATATLTYNGGQVITPGMTISDVVAPDVHLTWSPPLSTDLDLENYTVEWFDAPQQPSPSSADLQQSTTLPLTATRHVSFTAGQQQKLWARVSSRDDFDNPGILQRGPVYIDDELTPVYVDMGAGEAGGRPYAGWLQTPCNHLGQDDRPEGQALPGGTGQAQDFYTAWDQEGLRMTWRGADWERDGHLFIYLDTQDGGSIRAYDPFSVDGDTVYLPTYRVQTTTYRMAADWAIHVQFTTTAQLTDTRSFSASLLHHTGDQWETQPDRDLLYHFDVTPDAATTDLYLPFTSLSITHPTTQSLGLVAFATDADSLRLWAAMPTANQVNSQWVTGQTPEAAPWGLTQRYHWTSLGDGICPRDDGLTDNSPVQVSVETQGLGYSLLGNGLPSKAADHLSGLTGWGGVQNPICFEEPNLLTCTQQIDAAAPVAVDIRPYLMNVQGQTPPVLTDGQAVSVTVKLVNAGQQAARGIALHAQGWGLRLPGITQTAPITIPAGGQVTQILSGVIDSTYNPAADPDWATLDVVVLNSDSGHPQGETYLYPVDWLYVDYQVDHSAPSYIYIIEPDPVVNLIGTGEVLVRGIVRDQSSVPTITVDIEDVGHDEFTCVDPTPEDGQWTCRVNVSGLTSGELFFLRVRATDIHGHTSGWFSQGNQNDYTIERRIVDSTPPSVTLSAATQAALSDGWIGPNETQWRGTAQDNYFIEALDVCDPASGDSCTRVENLAPPDGMPSNLVTSDHVAEDGGLWLPKCPNVATVDHLDMGRAVYAEVRVGLVISHPNRSDVRVKLRSSCGSSRLTMQPSSPLVQHYNITLDDASLLPVWEDGGDHGTAPPYYENVRSTNNELNPFRYNGAVCSDWYLEMCDTQQADRGAYMRSQIIVRAFKEQYGVPGEWRYDLPVTADMDGVQQTRELAAIDYVGERSPTTTLSYRVDVVAPALTVDHALVDQDRFYLRGAVSDGGAVRIVRMRMTTPDGRHVGEVLSQEAGAWLYHAPPTPYVAGRYTLWIEAEDQAGNSTQAGPFALTLPELPNRVEQVSPANGATNVARNQPISVDFSQAMDTGSVNWAISPTLLLTPTWNLEKTHLQLAHPYFAANTDYQLVIQDAVNEAYQVLENVPYTVTFATGTTIANEADLEVALALGWDGSAVPAGDIISYTATITNHGPEPTTSALLSFEFSPSDSLAWASGPGGCTWDGAETITCNLPDVSSATPSHITVQARTRETFGQNYVLRTTANVAPPGGIVDPNTLNNQTEPVLAVMRPTYKIYLPLILKGG